MFMSHYATEVCKCPKKPDSICDFRSCPVGKILILVALFLNFGIQYVSAKHNWPNEVGSGITTSWHPDGGYIYLKIPVWDDDGSDILTYNAGFHRTRVGLICSWEHLLIGFIVMVVMGKVMIQSLPVPMGMKELIW